MPHEQLLGQLAEDAARAASSVQEAASKFWSSIERDSRLPNKPYSGSFRENAFSAFGDATRNRHFGQSPVDRPERRRRR